MRWVSGTERGERRHRGTEEATERGGDGRRGFQARGYRREVRRQRGKETRDGSVKTNDGEEGEGKGLRVSVLKGKGRESVFPNLCKGKHFPQIKFIFCVDRKGGEKCFL